MSGKKTMVVGESRKQIIRVIRMKGRKPPQLEEQNTELQLPSVVCDRFLASRCQSDLCPHHVPHCRTEWYESHFCDITNTTVVCIERLSLVTCDRFLSGLCDFGGCYHREPHERTEQCGPDFCDDTRTNVVCIEGRNNEG